MKQIKILLASPRGFCAGVVRAIDIVEKTLNKFGSPVYVRHEIVHNKHVVDDLKKKVLDIKNNYDKYNKGELIESRKEYAKKFSCKNKCKLMLEM